MVAFKWFYLAAALVASAIAQDDIPLDDADSATYWDAAGVPGAGVDGDVVDKRGISAKMSRNEPVLKDPYKGLYCKAKYTEPPCETKCNRNNCFRALLNARDGSPGKHCPKEAFSFCCVWNNAKPKQKAWAVKSGKLAYYFPYTANCKNDGDSVWNVVDKLNDACGCTLNHEVKVDITSDYYALRHYGCGDKHCH